MRSEFESGQDPKREILNEVELRLVLERLDAVHEPIVEDVDHHASYFNGSHQVKARVRWQPINDEDPTSDGWLHSIDHFYWRKLG